MSPPGQGSLVTNIEEQAELSGGMAVRGYGSKGRPSQEIARTERKCQRLWGIFLQAKSNSQGGFWRLDSTFQEAVSCLCESGLVCKLPTNITQSVSGNWSAAQQKSPTLYILKK